MAKKNVSYIKDNQKIPNSWKICKLSDVVEVVSGGTPSTKNDEYWDGEILWATPTDISKSDKYIKETTRQISDKGLEKSSAILLPPKSVLLTSRATIGLSSINLYPTATNQGFKSLVPTTNINHEFLYYLVFCLKKEMMRKASGSTFLEIAKKDVETIRIALPPLEEQEKIASILSTWDDAINDYKLQVENYLELKETIGYSLLTGEIRLVGFSEKWKHEKLKNLGNFFNGGSLSKNDIQDNMQNKVILYGELYTRYGEIINRVSSRTGMKLEGQVLGEKGDVLFPSSTTANAHSLINPSCLMENTVILGGDLFIFRATDENVYGPFLSYYFNGPGKKELVKLAQGITIIHIYSSDVKQVSIPLPSLEEQKEIVQLLENINLMINHLKKMVKLIEEQKRGLMQLLLTGKVRV